MLKKYSGRFAHVVGQDETDIDNGAEKPEAPKIHKKEKRAKGTPTQVEAGPAPAIFQKPEKQALKHGHDPNKINGVGASTRNIIVQPSQRHMNVQPSMRNISIDQKSMRNMNSLDQKSMRNMSSLEKKSSMRNMNNLGKKNGMRILSDLDEESSMRNVNNIDKKTALNTNSNSIDPKSSRNVNNTDLRSPRNVNPNKTGSTNSNTNNINKSPGSVDNKSNSNDSSISISIDNKSNSNHSGGINNNTSSTRSISINSKSNNSKSDITKNSELRSPQRKPRKRAGTTFANPVHFNRDRPSTALITRKELEDILAEKMKEEVMEKKTKPPKSGTLSTDLWVAEAEADEDGDQSSEFFVPSDEESPTGGKKKSSPDKIDDEYDINFFDFSETEETVPSNKTIDHVDSYDVDELNLANSMERRLTTIRFDEYDELQTCLHINDFTKGEISRSWYKREDYDKMVNLARKTASKAVKREKELRDELETMLRVSQSPPRAGRRKLTNKGDLRDDPAGRADNENDNKNGDNTSGRSRRSVGSNGTNDGKRIKPIEYRGLEAWTPEGSAKCRLLKETAIELVWNEQSRQWEDGTFDDDRISAVYQPVARTALSAAQGRAAADAKMVKKLNDQEEARAEKKLHRGVYHKSKAVFKKTAKTTGKGLVQGTGKLVTQTGKVGMTIGKRGVKAGLATATLDPRMMKEALKVRMTGKKKRECKHENIIASSQAAKEQDAEELQESDTDSFSAANSFQQRPGLQRPALATTYEFDKVSDDMSSQTGGDYGYPHSSSHSVGESESQLSTSSPQKKKKSKLKLLGIVPIPGTQKMYSEDRREQRVEKRITKMTRRPSWEASMMTGKY